MFESITKKLNFFIIIFIALAFFLAGLLFVKTDIFNTIRIQASLLTSCRPLSDENKQIDCVFNTIDTEMKKTGTIDGGMRVFMAARNSIESFGNENLNPCHPALHRVGDIAYYNLYLNAKNILDIDFPQETSGCLYGFFHGFVEHIIQNNPNSLFATETCESLIPLKKRMSYVLDACFHGLGHGFVRAQMDQVSREKWSDFQTITGEPLLLCGQLPKREYKRACWSGIFQTLFLSEYELNFLPKNVLRECPALTSQELQDECYLRAILHFSFETPFVFETPIESLNTIVKFVKDTEEQQTIFRFVIITQTVETLREDNNDREYTKILALCESIRGDFYKSCIAGIIGGILFTATPQEEHRLLLPLCSEPTIAQKELRALCYEMVFNRLLYFYTPPRMISICKKFPVDVQDECKKLSLR